MIGYIHKILFGILQQTYGSDMIDSVKVAASVDPITDYRMNTAYPDDEWNRLLAATLKLTSLPEQEFLKIYAKHFIEDAVKRWPTWFSIASSAREFLKFQPMIHNSFASGLVDPAARKMVTDKFQIEEHPHHLTVHYKSKNKLCGLYVALAREVAKLYQDTIKIDQPFCMHRGDAKCEFHVFFKENSETHS